MKEEMSAWSRQRPLWGPYANVSTGSKDRLLRVSRLARWRPQPGTDKPGIRNCLLSWAETGREPLGRGELKGGAHAAAPRPVRGFCGPGSFWAFGRVPLSYPMPGMRHFFSGAVLLGEEYSTVLYRL
jgi:hypothetical protein